LGRGNIGFYSGEFHNTFLGGNKGVPKVFSKEKTLLCGEKKPPQKEVFFSYPRGKEFFCEKTQLGVTTKK